MGGASGTEGETKTMIDPAKEEEAAKKNDEPPPRHSSQASRVAVGREEGGRK